MLTPRFWWPAESRIGATPQNLAAAVNIVVQDAAFAGAVEARLQKLIDGSAELDPDSEYWKRERTQRAVVATLWPGTFYS